ncbi:hypothetical protein BTVI_24149 [Pitangus sulphuratus]|nr:hypothetical protein BTVI_24149 [Pitangus sulphuratus]
MEEENARLRKKSCQAKQGNVILLDERCFWKDTAWSFSQHGCRHLTHLLDLLSCGLILPLCKAVSILVTVITGIQLLARCWRSYQSQRESTGGWSKSPHSVAWGAADYPECAICLQACEPGRALKLLSCSHVYHGKCIDRWHRAQPGSKTCPLCLYGVTTVVLIHPRAHSKQE